MMPLGALALGIAPGLFWLWFFYSRDKLEPEPKALVIKMFFLGMLGVVPAFFLEVELEQYQFFSMVILAPVLEELIKFLIVLLFVYRDKEFNEPMDGIVYAAAVALGFASAENPLYVLDAFPLSGMNMGMEATGEQWEDFWRIVVIRAVLTVPGHALWSCIWGYALGRARFMPPGQGNRLVVLGLMGGIAFHSLHNLAAVYVHSFAPVAIFAIAVLFWIKTGQNIRAALAESPFAPGAKLKAAMDAGSLAKAGEKLNAPLQGEKPGTPDDTPDTPENGTRGES